jgi:hypothetical protein
MSGIIKPGEALATTEEKMKVAIENIGGVVAQHEEFLKIISQLLIAVKPVMDQITVKPPPEAEKKEEVKKEEKKEDK